MHQHYRGYIAPKIYWKMESRQRISRNTCWYDCGLLGVKVKPKVPFILTVLLFFMGICFSPYMA